MSSKHLLALCAAAGLLSACEKYTEQTSPCFGRNGEPQVMRSAAQAVSTAGAGFSQNRRVEQAVAGGCGGGQLVEQPAQLSALMVGQLQALQPLRQRLLPGLPELQQALGGGPLPAGVSKTWVVVQRAQVQPALHGEQHLLKGLAQVTGVVTGLGCQAA